jgi:hypothetical protein
VSDVLTTTRPRVLEPDVAAARRTLRDQVARLESELLAFQCSTFPTVAPVHVRRVARGGPRLLSLGELEAVRDELHRALDEGRA